jgi:hypothetical protein
VQIKDDEVHFAGVDCCVQLFFVLCSAGNCNAGSAPR